MAASQTVPQYGTNCNFSTKIEPQQGVVTLSGYGIRVQIERGHLALEDGIGPYRRYARLPRVGHGLRRLVLIGSDGMVTLAALRWLADQNAAFVMLDRDGSVLTVCGPVSPSDARLRRAQSLASRSDVGLEIARELIDQKLAGQAKLVFDAFGDAGAAQKIASARTALKTVREIENVRYLEAQAGLAYWSAWRSVQLAFPKSDIPRIPDHWRSFGARLSPLTRSPRLAVNPPNAILNYLYAILETEARLAIAALGLDPGLGFLHFDTRTRDSLACDLMEPVRPKVDAYLLDWLKSEAFRKDWFLEQRDGNCRLMGEFAARLTETATTWSRAVAPLAEWIAHVLWKTTSRPARRRAPSTRLTQLHRRHAKGAAANINPKLPPQPPSVCRGCGAPIQSRRTYCASCGVEFSRESLIEVAKLGRVAGHSPEARNRQAEKQRQHASAVKSWHPSDKPEWLTEKVFREQIQPRLASITVPVISSALGVSEPYAALIRTKRYLPHPRHWLTLANLACIDSGS